MGAEGASGLDARLAEALRGRGWSPVRALKRDGVSEVWLLEGARGPALLKRARAGRLLFGVLPALLGSREVRILRCLEGIPGVPRVLERIDPRTFVREYVDGSRLRDVPAVPDDYFPSLLAGLAAVHGRGVACVDLSKRENLLVDRSGRPALVDFQAAFHLRPGGFPSRLLGPILRLLQRGDVYHVYKHHRRHFPGNPIPPRPAWLERKPLGVRIHKVLLRKPYLKVKRLLFGRTKG